MTTTDTEQTGWIAAWPRGSSWPGTSDVNPTPGSRRGEPGARGGRRGRRGCACAPVRRAPPSSPTWSGGSARPDPAPRPARDPGAPVGPGSRRARGAGGGASGVGGEPASRRARAPARRRAPRLATVTHLEVPVRRRPRSPWSSLMLAVAGCSGSSGGAAAGAGAEDLLAKAKATLDAASSVHFSLTGSDLPDGGTRHHRRRGRGGAARRPSRAPSRCGSPAPPRTWTWSRVDGTFYAKLPFTAGFADGRPGDARLRRPGRAARPAGRAVRRCSPPAARPAWPGRPGSTARCCTEVTVTLPGQRGGGPAHQRGPDARRSPARVGVAANGEVRRVVLTGPFFDAAHREHVHPAPRRLRRAGGHRCPRRRLRPTGRHAGACCWPPSPSWSPPPTPTSWCWRCPR